MAPTTKTPKKDAVKPSASAGPSGMPKHSQPQEKPKPLDGKTVLRNNEVEESEKAAAKADAMVEKDGVPEDSKRERAMIAAVSESLENQHKKAAAAVPVGSGPSREFFNLEMEESPYGSQAGPHSPEASPGTPIYRGETGFGGYQPGGPLPGFKIQGLAQETVGQEPEMQEDEEDEEEKEVLWSPTVNRKRQGLKEWDLRHIGTLRRWGEMYVMADGPKNSISYRIHKSKDMAEYTNPEALDLMTYRYGDEFERNEKGKKSLKYKRYAREITGVAWYVDPDLLDKFPEEFPNEVDLLKPRKCSTDYPILYKEGNVVKYMKAVDCLIEVRYDIDGVKEKRWETRTTVRAYWGTEKADQGVYTAAIAQEDRFENWCLGKREGRDASATPGRQLTPARSKRLATVEIDRASREPTPVTAKTKAVHFDNNEEDAKVAKIRARYEKMYGKSFAQMSREEKREMMSVLEDE